MGQLWPAWTAGLIFSSKNFLSSRHSPSPRCYSADIAATPSPPALYHGRWLPVLGEGKFSPALAVTALATSHPAWAGYRWRCFLCRYQRAGYNLVSTPSSLAIESLWVASSIRVARHRFSTLPLRCVQPPDRFIALMLLTVLLAPAALCRSSPTCSAARSRCSVHQISMLAFAIRFQLFRRNGLIGALLSW